MPDPKPPKPPPVIRVMCRCDICRLWWSEWEDQIATATCPCGGKLVQVDMDVHISLLPKP